MTSNVSPTQKEQLESYFDLAKSFAKVSTHFAEERFREGAEPQEFELDNVFDDDADDVIKLLKSDQRDKIQHAKIDSLLRNSAFVMPPDLPGLNPSVAKRYEEILHAEFEAKVKRFADAMHPEVRKILPDIIKTTDLKEHGSSVYIYGVGRNRIIKPEYQPDAPHKITSYSVILPFDHLAQMLIDPDAENYARSLLPQFKEFCEDARWLKGKIRRAFGHDTNMYRVIDDQALLHNLVKYTFEKVPGVVPILESMVNHRAQYSIDGYEFDKEQVLGAIKTLKFSYNVSGRRIDKDEIRHALRETGLLRLNKLSLAEAKKTASAADRGEIEWTERMLMDFDKISKLNKKLWSDPLNGENVVLDDDAEENIRQQSKRLIDRRHAWNRRSPSGRYLGLEHELNKEAGIWFRITHDLYIASSAIVDEIGHDAGGVMRKFLGYQSLLDANARNKLQGFIGDLNLSGAKVGELYDQLYQATKSQNGSVIGANPWGALLQDHKWHINFLILKHFMKNAWDHDPRGMLKTAWQKLNAAIREGKEFEFIVDLLTEDHGNAHKRKYGKIETGPLAEASDALLAATRTYLGKVPDGLIGEQFYDDMRVRIGRGLHEHGNNIKMMYAAGAYLSAVLSQRERKDNDERLLKAAESHLLDVKGWIESARDRQYDNRDENEMIYVHHQLLSAAEYQLARHYAEIEEDNEYSGKKLIIDAYRHYNEFAGWVQMKMERGDNVIPIYKKNQIDTGAVNSKDPERLVKHLLLAPMNFHARRQAVDALYENGYASQANELVQRTYHDAAYLVSEKGLLTADDMVEVARISDIASRYKGATLPADLGAAFSHSPRRREYFDKLLAYQGHARDA